ncbi:MAG: polyprenol monophosphomannose synthase [Prevotellaceae bacterium]|jgi:dolichol-phosphate mannosyltransferase|nr:polyprenol monophosphomannose synthase [Prevotellaceae bacterium]
MADKKLIIIPTYNEKENIAALIGKIFALNKNFEILIIDDSSPDGTAGIVRKLMKRYPDLLNLMERPEKSGLGTAYIAGFKYAVERRYDYIFEMDADFSHNPRDLTKLYDACRKGADVAIGSRYISGVNVVNWPIGRVIMSYYASSYVRMITGMNIKDTTAGFKCYKLKALDAIDFDRIKMKGYGFQIEMKYTAWKLGFSIVEVPIIFIDRKRGSSKMNSGIFGEAAWGVFRLRFRKIKPRHT